MIIRLGTTLRNTLADAITAAIDAGSGAGTIKVYAGTLPAGLSAGSDTLLATFNLTDPSAAAAVTGVADFDFDPDISATVAASGTAGYYLAADSTGTVKLGGDVGTSGASMNFDSVAWVAGGTVNLTTGTVTMPATS